jgi:hypothetical protein
LEGNRLNEKEIERIERNRLNEKIEKRLNEKD